MTRNWMLLTRGAVEFRDGQMAFLGVTRQELLRDLSIALSRMYRSGGRRKWSVAQHSLLVAQLVQPELRLAALVHDIEEPFTGDMPKPWLDQLPAELRDRINTQRAKTREEILRFLGISPWSCDPDHKQVKGADMAAFWLEVNHFDKTNLDRVEKAFGLTVERTDKPPQYLDLSESAAADLWYDRVTKEMAL